MTTESFSCLRIQEFVQMKHRKGTSQFLASIKRKLTCKALVSSLENFIQDRKGLYPILNQNFSPYKVQYE